jgi:hypothetical protein
MGGCSGIGWHFDESGYKGMYTYTESGSVYSGSLSDTEQRRIENRLRDRYQREEYWDDIYERNGIKR